MEIFIPREVLGNLKMFVLIPVYLTMSFLIGFSFWLKLSVYITTHPDWKG